MALLNPSNKTLSVFSLVMINVIAVDSLRTLPISAVYGFSLVFFYLLAGIIFFIPIALISAELATGWPKTGGLYVWVREAFGERTGLLAIWLQWIYNVVWYPTILAFLATSFAYLFDPQLASNKFYISSIVLLMLWIATLINCLGMRASTIVSTIGTLIGTLLPIFFIIALGALWLINDKPSQINFSWQSFFPHMENIKNLAFLSAVLFGLIGLEMSAVHAEEVKNPHRDYPRALLYSAVIILASLILASLAIALVVPHKDLSLISGLIDAFTIFFQAYHMPWMKNVIIIMIIIGGLSSVSAWLIGPTKGLLAAARAGDLPAIFQKSNRHGAPIVILILQAMIVTLLCLIFLLFPSVSSSYWLLSALTAQLALLVYVLMFAAAIRLRYSHAHIARAYRIPGNNAVMWIISGAGIVACITGMIIGFFPPEAINIENIFIYESILVSGLLLFSLPPFILFALRKRV